VDLSEFCFAVGLRTAAFESKSELDCVVAANIYRSVQRRETFCHEKFRVFDWYTIGASSMGNLVNPVFSVQEMQP
jgi:hypothetical protein